MNIYSNTISTTNSPVLICTDPLPDGNICLYINLDTINVFYIEALIFEGVVYCMVTGGLVSVNGNNMTTQLPDGSNMYVNYIYNNSSSNGLYISSDNPQSNVLVNAWTVPSIFTGALTSSPVYTSAGLVSNSLTWTGATTTTSGSFAADISSAGITTVNSVNATAVGNSSTSLTIVSATSVSGSVAGASDGTVVYLTVYGQ